MKCSATKSSASLLLLIVIAAAICSSGSASSSPARNNAVVVLPKSRVTHPAKHLKPTAATTSDVELEDVNNNSNCELASFRGGASAAAAAAGLSTEAISGVIAMWALEIGLKKFFKVANLNFPSMLGGCVFLFVAAVVAEMIHPGWGDKIYLLDPGSALLAKWLPSFFVPGLAMLPLAPSIGSGVEVAKSLGVVALGLLYSLSTICFSVLALRKAQGATNEPPVAAKAAAAAVKAPPKKQQTNKNAKKDVAPTSPPTSPAPKPFPVETLNFLATVTTATLVACVAAFRLDLGAFATTPLQTATLILSTLTGFVWAVRLPPSINKVVHPLITTSAVTVVMVQVIALGIGSDLKGVLKSYKVGSLNPMKMGAGDLLLGLLGPSVVSFAVSMYSRKHLIYENLLTIIASMLVGSVGGLFGTAAFVRAINLGGSNGNVVRLSILGRNVTTALSLVIASILGGDISIAAVFVVLTGVLGATYGKSLLQIMGIHDPITRGLGIGGAAQGLGVASMADEPDAFPFAAISMVLTAVCATTLVSIPVTRDALINLATGGGITVASSPVP